MPSTRTDRPDRAAEAARKARELILFCDGLDRAGYDTYAHRARWVARETLWLAGELELERLVRQAMQRERDRLMELWMSKAGRAT